MKYVILFSTIILSVVSAYQSGWYGISSQSEEKVSKTDEKV